MIPVAFATLYVSRFSPDEETLEAEIRQRHGVEVQMSTQNNQDMKSFFQKTMQSTDDQRLDEVLRGGRGAKKRLYAVDEKLYGTQEGVEEKKRQEELQKERKREKRRAKKEAAQAAAEGRTVPQKESSKNNAVDGADSTPTRSSVEFKSVVAVSAVAVGAAALGFLAGAGGSRRA